MSVAKCIVYRLLYAEVRSKIDYAKSRPPRVERTLTIASTLHRHTPIHQPNINGSPAGISSPRSKASGRFGVAMTAFVGCVIGASIVPTSSAVHTISACDVAEADTLGVRVKPHVSIVEKEIRE